MHDRQPTPGMEGRMQVLKEDGTSFYARIVMADNPLHPGTPLNKSTLLKDQTAALFGLLEDAVPDDVYAWLGKYNQHWWRRQAVTALHGYSEVQTQAKKNNPLLYYNRDVTINYSSNITINQTTGVISLVNPQSFTISRYTFTTKDQINDFTALLDGKYVTGMSDYDPNLNPIQTSDTYYVPVGTKWDAGYSDDLGYYYIVFPYGNTGYYINRVTAQIFNLPAGAVSYVHSTNRNAYPDSGESGGYKWEYLGVPFDNAVMAPKIAVGSYFGTGTDIHAENPMTITFGFAPKVVFMQRAAMAGFHELVIAINGCSDAVRLPVGDGISAAHKVYFAWNGNTFTWWVNNYMTTWKGMNESGVAYRYVALG